MKDETLYDDIILWYKNRARHFYFNVRKEVERIYKLYSYTAKKKKKNVPIKIFHWLLIRVLIYYLLQ